MQGRNLMTPLLMAAAFNHTGIIQELMARGEQSHINYVSRLTNRPSERELERSSGKLKVEYNVH